MKHNNFIVWMQSITMSKNLSKNTQNKLRNNQKIIKQKQIPVNQLLFLGSNQLNKLRDNEILILKMKFQRVKLHTSRYNQKYN